jgi:ferrous iron transport protein B
MSTLAVVKRETNSWKYPLLQFVYMTAFAYVAALATFQIISRVF